MSSKRYLPKNNTGSVAKWWQLLQIWQKIGSWMIYKSEFYLQRSDVVCKKHYAHKARFYPYLPPQEEERDWLEENQQKLSS